MGQHGLDTVRVMQIPGGIKIIGEGEYKNHKCNHNLHVFRPHPKHGQGERLQLLGMGSDNENIFQLALGAKNQYTG